MRFYSSLLLACMVGACASGVPPEVAPAPTAAAVFAAEQAWYTALVRRDTVALSSLLANEFTLSGSAAVRETRAQYLSTAQMPERTLEPIHLGDRHVEVYGSTAVSTGRAELKGRWQERPIDLTVRYTSVFVLREGRWQAVASHLSSIE